MKVSQEDIDTFIRATEAFLHFYEITVMQNASILISATQRFLYYYEAAIMTSANILIAETRNYLTRKALS